MIFIHGTIVPRDNSIGKLLIMGDNIISLLQNKCFSFSKVLSSVTCNISAYTVKVCKSNANIIGFLQLIIEMAVFLELFH